MLDLKKSSSKAAENFLGKVEKLLVEDAQVRARKQEIANSAQARL